MHNSRLEYSELTVAPPTSSSPLRRAHMTSALSALAAFGLVCLIALSAVGIRSLVSTPLRTAPAVMMMTAAPAELPGAGMGGGCKCSNSDGAVCCCCSHCGCGQLSPGRRHLEEGEGQTGGGHWDADVGGIGSAGGGLCQCNSVCCCCSSCDCTGPGVSIQNSSIKVAGNCNGVENCVGDVPARRLSEAVRGMLERRLR